VIHRSFAATIQFAAEKIMAKANRGIDGATVTKVAKSMLKALLKETGSASLHEYLRHHHK
jgi:hypothetical protein